MCRLFALTSREPVSPILAIKALDVMKEGHDGSGLGILLQDLGGPFEKMKDAPVLSGIFSKEGIRRLDLFMMKQGFLTKYKISLKISKKPVEGIPRRDIYLIRTYELPEDWDGLGREEIARRLLMIRVKIREMGEEKKDMIVFSFWPDTIIIKEIGDPIELGSYLDLDRKELNARLIMAQGRQNTNYAIDLYACHPFFIKGYSTMTNGENTAFIQIRNFLLSRGYPGYTGYQSDSEVFAHILHYAMEVLGLDISVYKHIITPLQEDDLKRHPDAEFLSHLKKTCRQLIIDGPSCVIGALPDHSLFMVQDRKKLRPGVIGGRAGLYGFSSEICGLDVVIPDRDKSLDIQPMHLDTVIVNPDRREVRTCRQTEALNLPL